ncbi:hypothetical protein [Mycobacterium sp.]|uniref:hypothetical protein n=1 Tax=Mycobacterium sp. TaxID=1785 RepID=UPI002C172250|nr:hypothetical protein [Mycobacterium sp.]HKP42108.1 hypothetical protein [Mycobacterium sp.]
MDGLRPQKDGSIDCQMGYNPVFGAKPTPMRLFWFAASGTVRLVEYHAGIDGRNVETEVFNVPANAIKQSVIADASTTLILTLPERRYKLFLGEKALEQTGRFYPLVGGATMIAGMALGSIESRADGLYDFQRFLSTHNVRTKRSSMLRLIVGTILVFVLVLSVLIGVLAIWLRR